MTDFTKQTKSISEKSIKRDWYLVDVKGKILGRVIRDVVNHLTGKNKVNYVSYLDSGDNVVVINASGVKLSGKKMETKIYTNYSGYPSGLRTVSIQKLFQTRPQEIITHAVSGMLPKNKHRDKRMARLFVFPSDKHSYTDKFKVKS